MCVQITSSLEPQVNLLFIFFFYSGITMQEHLSKDNA